MPKQSISKVAKGLKKMQAWRNQTPKLTAKALANATKKHGSGRAVRRADLARQLKLARSKGAWPSLSGSTSRSSRLMQRSDIKAAARIARVGSKTARRSATVTRGLKGTGSGRGRRRDRRGRFA